MKILHVIPGLTSERGGPSSVVEALARHQSAAGHEVTVLTTDQGQRRGERPVVLPGSVDVVQAAVFGPDRVAYSTRFRRLAKARLRACDLVHVHSIFTYPVHVVLRTAAAAGVPLVLRPCGHLHRYSLRRSRWRKWAYLARWGRMVASACTAWHYTSDHESAGSWPWDSSPRFVLPNGIEPGDYALDREEARAEAGRRWPLLGDAPYVLFLARLHPKKRLDLLLEAFLAGAPAEYKLVVAGPDECGLWKVLARRLLMDRAVKRRVVRLGMTSGRDKAVLLAGATLFALASEHENLGITVLEALAAGTPVLLSPHVDLADQVVAGNVGSVAPLEADAWRDRLAMLLGDSPALTAAAKRARTWVQERYAWSRIAGELAGRYRWVLEGCPTEGLVSRARRSPVGTAF